MTTGEPGAHVGGDDVFTPAEAAFFSSAGQTTEGLFEVAKAEPAAPAGDEPAKTEAKAESEKKEPGEAGEIEVSEDGKARSTKTGRYVPIHVVQGEREAHKATKTELAALRSKMDAVFAKIDAAQGETAGTAKAADAKPEELIDPEKDIFGAHKQATARLAALEKRLADQQRETDTRLARGDAERTYEADVRRFTEKQADFPEAYKAVVLGRARQLMLLDARFTNEDGSPNVAAIQKQIRDEESQIRDQALARKVSPAQVMYDLAAVYGYKLTPKTEAGNGGSENKSANGKTPAEEIVDRIAKGQEGDRTLSKAGGGGEAGLTMDAFLAMDETVIASRMRTDPSFKRQVDAIMGKR